MSTTQGRLIVWSARSRNDLERINSYITQFAPMAAGRFTGRLVAAVESLALQPDRGRPVAAGIRELVVVAPYLVRYRVSSDEVRVIRIRHGARRPG